MGSKINEREYYNELALRFPDIGVGDEVGFFWQLSNVLQQGLYVITNGKHHIVIEINYT